MYTPDEMKEWYSAWRGFAIKSQWPDRVDELDGEYGKESDNKDFKKTKKGKGMFWAGVVNPDRRGDSGVGDCTRDPFWVPKGETPTDVPQAVSPEVLAKAAWAAVRIPGVKLRLSPAGKQTVNLDTWAWADRGAVHPVSVTARLPEQDLWATTTATPASLRLDPGTGDAVTYPASGVCAADQAGRIGVPYRKGDGKKPPPCGIRYQHASTGGPFTLKATITWDVSWTGSGGTGGDLPSGTYGRGQDVTVQEVQSVVEGTR